MTSLRPRPRRRLLAVPAAALVAAGVLAAVGPQASAIESPVAFSAVDLPTYQTDGIAWTTASASGLVFVGGAFATLRPPGTAAGDPASVPRANFAVLDAATGTPTSCAPAFLRPGAPTPAVVRSLALSPDDRTLYVGGLFSSVDGLRVDNLVALDVATCKVVSSFRPVVDGIVRAIAVSDTRVYVGGEFTKVADTARGRIAALSSVGTTTPGTLLSWVPYFDDAVEALALSPDGGRLVVGGKFKTANGLDSHALAVLTPGTGSVEKAYPGFIMANSHVKRIAVDLTGFYTGNEGDGPGVFDGRIAVDWSTLTERWRDVCLGATQSVLVWRGVLYSASHAHNCLVQGEYPDGTRHHLLAQTTSSPTTKLGWFPNTNEGMGEAIGPRDLTVARTATADYLYVVGEFTGVNGHSQVGITRFTDQPDAAPGGLKVSVTSFKAGQIQVAWRPAIDDDNRQLTYALYRDGGSTPIWTTTRTSTFWSRPQITYLDDQPAGSTHRYRITATDGLTTIASAWRQTTAATTSSAYAAKVLADGATLYWRYDDPADVYLSDSSAGGDLGTVRGGATFGVTGPIQGDASKAITLPGGGSAFLYSDHLAPAPTRLSVETWFRTTTRFGGKLIGFGDKFELKSFNYDRHLYLSNSGQVNWGVQGWGKAVITSPRAYNDGTWHHAVGTLDGGRMALYLDGQLVGTSFINNPLTYTGLWRIGDDAVSGWAGSPSVSSLAGSWDETAVYPVALTAAQVAAHYAFGATDSQPPSAPTGLTAATATGGVALAWRPSTDDLGVTGYEVYRATVSTTPPSAQTRIATVSGTTTSYLDPSPVVGTRNFYRVIALDAAGHRSTPSDPASIVVFPRPRAASPAATSSPSSSSATTTSPTAATSPTSPTATAKVAEATKAQGAGSSPTGSTGATATTDPSGGTTNTP